MSNGNVGAADTEALTKHAMSAEFLFSEQIVSFMNEAYHKALDLEMWAAKISKSGQDLPESEKKTYQDTVTWFSTHANAQLKLFSADLKMERQERHKVNYKAGFNRIYVILVLRPHEKR